MEIMSGGRSLLLSPPQDSTMSSQRVSVTMFIQRFPKKNDGESRRHGRIMYIDLRKFSTVTWRIGGGWGGFISFGMNSLIYSNQHILKNALFCNNSNFLLSLVEGLLCARQLLGGFTQ